MRVYTMADVRAYLDAQKEAPYDLLLEVFGDPEGPSGDGKCLATWDMQTPHGWAEVYDYKDYEAHGDPRKVGEWHVQASNQDALSWVFEQIESARIAQGAEENISS